MSELGTAIAPPISVVTPSLNQGRYIAAAIESVAAQSQRPLEHIVVDGGSTDETLEVLDRYAHLPYLRWISEPDTGQSDAINKGVALARGEVVGWLNADDRYYPDALAAIANAFARHPDADVVYGAGARIDETGRVVKEVAAVPFDRRRIRSVFFVVQPAMFFRRRTFLGVGGLTESTHFCMDWEFLLKLGPGARVYAIPDPVGQWRVYPDTKTGRGGWERMREIALVGRRYNGPLDRNYVSFRVREFVGRWAPPATAGSLRRLVDEGFARLWGRQNYMVQGWPPGGPEARWPQGPEERRLTIGGS
jgi:glycosyltransferase involved in cell wall biosynthesis